MSWSQRVVIAEHSVNGLKTIELYTLQVNFMVCQ